MFLLIIPFSFCACDLADLTAFERNNAKYYNQTVATVKLNNKDVIDPLTLQDLITAINSYGYQYAENNKITEDVIKQTLDMEIQRRLIVKESKRLFADSVTNAELNTVFQKTYDDLNSNLATYEKEIREEKGYPALATEEDAEETENEFVKKDYTAKAFVVNGEIVLNQDAIDLGYTGDPNAELIGDDKNLYDSFMKYRKITTEEISNLALARYIKNLKLSEEGKRLSTADKEVFTREIERIYNLELNNFYITKLQTEYYKNNLISKDDVLNYYKSLVKSSYDKYAVNIESYYTDMQDDVSKVYYNPNGEYKFVSHILIKYTDEQTALISQWENDLKSGRIGQEDYDANMAYIKTQITTKARDSQGETYGNNKTVSDIYNEVAQALNNTNTLTQKAEVFNNLVYKYNADPGIMNKDYNYVVGLTHSSMVDEFNETSRELFNQEKGSIGIAYTTYGAHIIMYVDDIENVINYNNLDNITLDRLNNVRLQLGEEKTLFNKLYDELYESISSTKYNAYQTNKIADLKEGLSINYKQNVYKSLIK